MRDKLRDKVLSMLTGLLVAVVVLGGTFIALPAFQRSKTLQRQNVELQEEIDRKKNEIATYRENQRRFRCDPDFVEKIARINHRVFPGEMVFIFEKE